MKRHYAVIRDRRDGRLFLDYNDTMIRSFEEVVEESPNKGKLQMKYGKLIDVTLKNPATAEVQL